MVESAARDEPPPQVVQPHALAGGAQLVQRGHRAPTCGAVGWPTPARPAAGRIRCRRAVEPGPPPQQLIPRRHIVDAHGVLGHVGQPLGEVGIPTDPVQPDRAPAHQRLGRAPVVAEERTTHLEVVDPGGPPGPAGSSHAQRRRGPVRILPILVGAGVDAIVELVPQEIAIARIGAWHTEAAFGGWCQHLDRPGREPPGGRDAREVGHPHLDQSGLGHVLRCGHRLSLPAGVGNVVGVVTDWCQVARHRTRAGTTRTREPRAPVMSPPANLCSPYRPPMSALASRQVGAAAD